MPTLGNILVFGFPIIIDLCTKLIEFKREATKTLFTNNRKT